MAADEKWYFTKEQLQNTPSRKCGFDADKELSYRQQAANFIQDLGQKLHVSQLCINTAIVYMHRFYMFHSFTHFPWNSIAAASFFLAAKVEEQPRKLEYVIRMANICLHRDQGAAFDAKSEQYAAQSQDLVFNENVLLQTLGFDVAIDHPHTHVVRCCHLVRASKDLAQTSYFMASNSLHLTTMCLQYKPTVVACFCIHLACKWSNWQIPKSNEGKDWFYYVDKTVTSELLEQLTTEFLVIFDKCPSRLKRKILSVSNSGSHSADTSLMQSSSSSSHTPNSNSPFDSEPRKTNSNEKDIHQRAIHDLNKISVSDDPHKKHQRPYDPAISQQRVEYREYREKKEKERLEREKPGMKMMTKPGMPPINKHLPPGSKLPHGHHRPPTAVDPKLKMQHRPSASREQPQGEMVKDVNAHANRESIPGVVNRDYNRETNGRENREAMLVHRDREHRDVHSRETNKDAQKHLRPEISNKVDSDMLKIDSADKLKFDINRQKVVDPKLLVKHDPNRHKYPKRPETVPNASDINKKPVPSNQQSALDNKNSYINKQTNSTSQRHKSPFSDVPKSVPSIPTSTSYPQKSETRNGNHTQIIMVPTEKLMQEQSQQQPQQQPWLEAPSLPDDPGLLSPPPKRQPSLFSPEKTTPPKKNWSTKTPPSTGKRLTDTPQLPTSTIPTAISPFASPPPKPTPEQLRRHRSSSSGSEPELRPVVKKLDQISGFENIIRDSKMGIKLHKVPDIIQPICDRSSEHSETSISKELKPPELIKPFNATNDIPLSQPLVNGIETNPTLISSILKEELVPPNINHLPVMEATKSPEYAHLTVPPVKTEPPTIAQPPIQPEPQEKHKTEHHHKSEKKKKKDKHKHKDKDKSKDEKKKKHKDKDKEKHKIKPEKTDEGEVPLKITIAMDKIQPPPESSGLKVKISKDRLKTDSIENTGSLKIKISKDTIQYNSVTDGTRKREREKTSPVPGPPAKQPKTNYNRNQDTRQNGRNSYTKVSYTNNNNTSNRGRYGNMQPRMPPPQVYQQNPQIFVPNYPPPTIPQAYMYQPDMYQQYYAGYQMYPTPDMYHLPQQVPETFHQVQQTSNAPPPLPDGPPPNTPPPPPPE